jgi:hypothetical protein
MLLEPWILLALVLLAIAWRWRASYRTWLYMLIASLGLAYAGARLVSDHAEGRAAAEYSAAAAARLDARPWPGTDAQILSLIASYRELDRFEASAPLESLYTIGRMHQLLGEPVPVYESVRAALAANTARLEREHRRQNRSEDSAILLERVVQAFLHASLPDAAADWPADLPAPQPGVNFRRLGEGAWLEVRTEYSGTAEDTVFPLGITNDGPGPVTDMQGSVRFYDPSLPVLPSGQPREVFSCFGLTIKQLAPGESRLFKCRFISSVHAFRTAEEMLEQLRRLRQGSLRAWVKPWYMDYVLWSPTAAEPLNADEVARYVQLKGEDRRYAQTAQRIRSGLMAWLALGSILLAGFVAPGLANLTLSRKGVLTVSIAGAIVALLVAPAVLFVSAAHDWGPLANALLALAGAGAFITGLALGNIVIARGERADEGAA